MPSKKDDCLRKSACFLRIRRGTFPYSIEDDASRISQTPTTHYTNTCVKLTIVTHLSFSERIAIANLSSGESSCYRLKKDGMWLYFELSHEYGITCALYEVVDVMLPRKACTVINREYLYPKPTQVGW